MQPFAINALDIHLQKGGGPPLKAPDKITAQSSQTSQDGSFASMLKSGDGPEAATDPVSDDKSGPPLIPPGVQSKVTDKKVADKEAAVDNSLQTAPADVDPTVSSPDQNETPVSLIDKATFLKFFADALSPETTPATLGQTAHPKTSPSLAAYAHRKGAALLSISISEEEPKPPKIEAPQDRQVKTGHESLQDRPVKTGHESPSALSESPLSSNAAARSGLQNESAFLDRVSPLLQHSEDTLAPDKITSEERRTFLLKQSGHLNAIAKAASPTTGLQAGLQKEPALLDRVAALLQASHDGFPAEDMDSRLHRSAVSTRSNHAVDSVKKAAPANTLQGPYTVDKGDLAAKMARPEQTVTQSESAAVMEPPDTAGRSRHSALAQVAASSELDVFALRAESLSALRSFKSGAPLTDILPGNRTQAVVDQILDARQAMNGDLGRVRIVLTPPNLGTVDLHILMRKERVEVLMTTDNSSVQQALLSRADDIRIALQRHDLKIDAFQVLLEDQTANQRQTDSGAMFQQNHERQIIQNAKDNDPVLPADALIALNETSKAANGGVSVFA